MAVTNKPTVLGCEQCTVNDDNFILDRKLLVIVLNTDYWSTKAYKINENVTFIGDIQMRWLQSQLESANKTQQKVFIVGHIPPG